MNSSKIPATARRRPVHFKATIRKDPQPEREKDQVHTGPRSLTETERKRYENMWASNYRQESLAMLSQEHNYIDNLMVRELWKRSNLPPELLGHIW